MENDPDEEEMDDVNIDDEREWHWRNVFEDNEAGVDDKKALLHAKSWDLYVNDKEQLVKGKYLVEVVGHDKKQVRWEVVGDHVVEDPSDHQPLPKAPFSYCERQLPPNTYPSIAVPSRLHLNPNA